MGRKRSAAAPEEKIELVLGASENGAQKRTGRPSDWTEAKADKFIEVLADSCNVSYAARAVERSVGNIYIQRAKDAAFRCAWDQAIAIAYSRLELMMLERALHGVEKVVTLKNGESRIMREYNDRVALALLRQHRDSVKAFEQGIDEQDYDEACERILEKLARLRERDLGGDQTGGGEAGADEPPIETKSANGRPAKSKQAAGKRRDRR